jgi:hypothetical protein
MAALRTAVTRSFKTGSAHSGTHCLDPARAWPLPAAIIEKETPYAYRYALNQNTDGYTAPYWGWPRWEHEIDVLAR